MQTVVQRYLQHPQGIGLRIHFQTQREAFQIILVGILAGCLDPSACWAQGTVKFGFEEYPLGITPSFVQQDDPFTSPPRVADGSMWPLVPIQPYEGQKLLHIASSALVASPSSELITEFTLYLYLPSSYAASGGSLFFGAGHVPGRPEEAGTWQRLSGTFDSPVQQFRIFGYLVQGQTIPAEFAIDAVELVTIPEPSTLSLLLAALPVVWLLNRRGASRGLPEPR